MENEIAKIDNKNEFDRLMCVIDILRHPYYIAKSPSLLCEHTESFIALSVMRQNEALVRLGCYLRFLFVNRLTELFSQPMFGHYRTRIARPVLTQLDTILSQDKTYIQPGEPSMPFAVIICGLCQLFLDAPGLYPSQAKRFLELRDFLQAYRYNPIETLLPFAGAFPEQAM